MMLTESIAIKENPIAVTGRLSIAIEAQRLFRKRKHGMDIVALELLERLPFTVDDNDYHVMVKNDIDPCLKTIAHRVTHVIKSAPYLIWEQFFLPVACRKAGVDILHCTANTAPLILNIPFILTLHDIIFLEKSNLTAGASWYQRLGNMYRSIVVKKVVKKAIHIITVSEFQKKLICEKLHIAEEKVTVIYNGADKRFFEHYTNERIETTLKKLQLTAGYIFFIANTDARKNTNGVLHAYAKLLDVNPASPRLVLKGLDEAQLWRLLKKEGLDLLRTKIDLIGYVAAVDLPAIYKGASMLWFPSFTEGFGLPIAEAMACGTPVITSRVSCMPEIAGDAALFIDPENPTSLAFTAHYILCHESVAEKLSAAGKKRAELFNWDVATRKTVEVYNGVKKMINK